jgi:hypothetical protein
MSATSATFRFPVEKYGAGVTRAPRFSCPEGATLAKRSENAVGVGIQFDPYR